MKTPNGEEITDELLCKTFPHLFRDRNAPMNQTAMCWGFEIGPGWMGIMYEAASKIEPIIVKMIDDALKTKNMEALDYIPCASQIKEKYGTLRFYMSYTTDEIEKIIEDAEIKSAKTCEQCGAKGKLKGTVWVITLCSKCWKEYEAKHGN